MKLEREALNHGKSYAAQFIIDHTKDAKSICIKIMKKMRENISNSFELHAYGRINIAVC